MATSLSEQKVKPASSEITPPIVWMYVGITVVAIGILYFTFLNFWPILQANQVTPPPEDKVVLPQFPVNDWRALPVQQGARLKPFETAAREMLRQIHGRDRLQGRDAVAVMLSWMLENDPDAKNESPSQWDEVAFILCEYQDLRRLIFQLEADGQLNTKLGLGFDDIHGKYMSPAMLRTFLFRQRSLESSDPDRYVELFGREEKDNKLRGALGEVQGRLMVYEHLRPTPANIRPNPMTGQADRPHDPFAFVALDKVKGSPWFSIAELRQLLKDSALPFFGASTVGLLGSPAGQGAFLATSALIPGRTKNPKLWSELYMKDRVKTVPQMYISKEHQNALEAFQQEVKAGNGGKAVDALAPILRQRRTKWVAEFMSLWETGKYQEAEKKFFRVIVVLPSAGNKKTENVIPTEFEEVFKDIQKLMDKEDKKTTEELGVQLNLLLEKRDQINLNELKTRLPAKAGYDPAAPSFRMLHLSYLELHSPDVWDRAAEWQVYPAENVDRVLAAYRQLGLAYRSGNTERFDEASKEFMTTVEQVSEKAGPYPGDDGISERFLTLVTGGNIHPPSRELLNLEMTFNRIAPFTWAWVLMLPSLLLLCLALGLQSRWCYRIGLGFYLLSLGFQLFGFFVRITISGRPPVSNIYETVVWVAFMSGIFALILEWIYKPKVIALAGAMVSTLGLVLADQMPLALDPKINPLLPVLRSNFWLTIHVLVIVSSYAGGTLAWGLGNITLVLMVFGRGKQQATIKMLSQFTYRALQIAVLLLAAGTFLGGWWAAYSWGRFWGWDPKETGALIALLCYVIPLHMRYIGWIKDFGLAVAAIFCYAAILMSWYGVNFLFPAGLHAYATGSAGGGWVYWASLINIEWVMVATLIYWRNQAKPTSAFVGFPGSETMGGTSEHIKE